jgi:hypothetical protein
MPAYDICCGHARTVRADCLGARHRELVSFVLLGSMLFPLERETRRRHLLATVLNMSPSPTPPAARDNVTPIRGGAEKRRRENHVSRGNYDATLLRVFTLFLL